MQLRKLHIYYITENWKNTNITQKKEVSLQNINTFPKLKYHAGGFPLNRKTDEKKRRVY